MDVVQTKTKSVARQYLKAHLRLEICRAKIAELGTEDPVWGSLAWLAESLYDEARQAWLTHAQGKQRATLMPYIMQALPEAMQEGTLPYAANVPAEWLAAQVQHFLTTFDVDAMLPTEGNA